ncbi:MAG: acyltransferase [Acidobacteriota bacterium]
MPELDGVRGVAIAMVMALHFVNNQVIPTNLVERAAIKMANYGLWGVDLFFVLSGFLITGILSDAVGRPGYFVNFFARRSLRIFPLYFGVLLLFTVLVPPAALGAFDPQLLEVRALWPWLWTYLTNVYLAPQTTFSIPYLSHFWSLAIEEHFYLVWPFLIAALAIVPAMRACVALGVAALALRIYFSVTAPDQLYADVLTPCRIDALCAGAWFALAARRGGGLPRRQTLQMASVAGGAVVALSIWNFALHSGQALVLPLRGTALAVFFGALIYSAAHHHGLNLLKAVLRFGWLQHLGRYSYGLYVFHGIVAYGMNRYGVPEFFSTLTRVHTFNSVLMVTSGVGVSYAVAIASYHGFELPFLSLKARFATRPALSSAG